MHSVNLTGDKEEPPSCLRWEVLKEFHPAGKGFWTDVSDTDWNDWHWQLKHRITTVEQLQRLMPTLTPEEFAGAALANHKLALAITPLRKNHSIPADTSRNIWGTSCLPVPISHPLRKKHSIPADTSKDIW